MIKVCALGLLATATLMAAAGPATLDAAGRPRIVKFGTIDYGLVETTPVVFRGRLLRFEWVRKSYWSNELRDDYFRFVDPAIGRATPAFAHGHEFGSAFVNGRTVFVTGTRDRSRIQMFASKDLTSWESWPVLNDPRFGIFNTSLCKAADEYVLMFEIDKPKEQAGVPFTARFLKSPDLRHWTLTAPECNYSKDRYTAPHCLRYLDGWFYNFYLEAFQGYEMRVVRSKDLIAWEPSPLNPVLRSSDEDRRIYNPRLPFELQNRATIGTNINNSDIDFCEYKGRLIINYSWGNQQGTEFLAEAFYSGTQKDFLRGWFPQAKRATGRESR